MLYLQRCAAKEAALLGGGKTIKDTIMKMISQKYPTNALPTYTHYLFMINYMILNRSYQTYPADNMKG